MKDDAEYVAETSTLSALGFQFMRSQIAVWIKSIVEKIHEESEWVKHDNNYDDCSSVLIVSPIVVGV